jgi:hypothetical protein
MMQKLLLKAKERRCNSMSDIFLSYAHEDLKRAVQLAQGLQHNGWDVFWDRTIPTGSGVHIAAEN